VPKIKSQIDLFKISIKKV